MSCYNWSDCIDITNTLQVIAQCWNDAEVVLRKEVNKLYPNSDEEFITRFFHGKLSAELELASSSRKIENAFLLDLQVAFPDLQYDQDLHRIAEGLVANITLHKRSTERVTGGDFGFVINRPQVRRSYSTINISSYRCGLLCQAKLKNIEGKWGGFTKNQCNILPKRINYLSLILYSYGDVWRRELCPFLWKLCNGLSFDEINKSLKMSSIPLTVSSEYIINALGNGRIGTDDDKIINNVISPDSNNSLIINIDWPDGDYARSVVYIYSSNEIDNNEYVNIND